MRKLSYVFIFSFTAIVFVACKKDDSRVSTSDMNVSQQAKVQFFNAAINSSRNYVYVDGKRVTGAAVSYAAPVFPASSYGFAISPGMHYVVLRDTLTATTQPWVTYTQTFDAGKHYTIFTYDTVNKAKYMIVPTDITVPTDTTARIRFTHLAHLHTPVPAVDIYSLKRKTNIWSNIPFGSVTDFTPYATASTDSLVVRPAGNTTVHLDTLGFNLTRQRSYTLVFRGRYLTNEATNATNPRVLTLFANY